MGKISLKGLVKSGRSFQTRQVNCITWSLMTVTVTMTVKKHRVDDGEKTQDGSEHGMLL